MLTCSRILIFFGAVIACSSCATAFFINWGSPDSSTIRPIQTYPVTYYHQRLLQGSPSQPQTYVTTNNGDQQQQPSVPVQIPAIPIQVPLQAQLSSISNIHNVELVPCMCPVSSDLVYERPKESSSVFLNQIKNPQD